LIAQLDVLGVDIRADGDQLRFRPIGLVPPALLAQLKAEKAHVLAVLGTAQPALGRPPCTECESTTWIAALVGRDGSRTCAACATGLTAMRARGVAI